MDIVNYIAIAGFVLGSFVVVGVSIWYVLRLSKEDRLQTGEREHQTNLQKTLEQQAREDFGKAVADNAQFIKEDVRHTTTELSGYMEKEISRTIGDELSRYKIAAGELTKIMQTFISTLQSDVQAQQKVALDQLVAQQKQLSDQLTAQYRQAAERADQQVTSEVERRMQRFETNMTSVVQSYVTAAVSGKLDVTSEFEYILKELEANKKSLLEDIQNGSA